MTIPSEQEVVQAQKICRQLTQSCEQLDDNIVTRLQDSRAIALRAQARQPHTVLTLNTGHFAHLLPHSGTQWIVALAMLAILATGASSYWQHTAEQELAHLDLAILTDDLPLEVFVDK